MRWVVNAAIILWYSTTAPCFGIQPACNHLVRSQSYFTVGYATKMPQRVTSIFNVTVTLLFITNDLFRAWAKYRLKSKFPGWESRQPAGEVVRLRGVTRFGELHGFVGWLFDNTPPSLPRMRHDTNHATSIPLPAILAAPPVGRIRRTARMMVANVAFALLYPKFQRYIISLAFTIMLVCNIEQTIRLNTVAKGENSWTYGQILAIMLTLQPVMQILQLLGFSIPNKSGIAKSKMD